MFLYTLSTITGDLGSSSVGSQAISITSILGYALLAIGTIATALSSQRYLLLYALAGMFYWLVIEGIQSALTFMLPLSSWHGYVAAMALSWLPICGWVIARALRYDTISPATEQRKLAEKSRYIEHTPVYDQYQPRFQ